VPWRRARTYFRDCSLPASQPYLVGEGPTTLAITVRRCFDLVVANTPQLCPLDGIEHGPIDGSGRSDTARLRPAQMSGVPFAFSCRPVLQNHDKSQFEVVCYSNSPIGDAVTASFRQSGDQWRNILSKWGQWVSGGRSPNQKTPARQPNLLGPNSPPQFLPPSTAIGSREPGCEGRRGDGRRWVVNLFERRENGIGQIGPLAAEAGEEDDGLLVRDPGQRVDHAR
jgi:hypothetical protein